MSKYVRVDHIVGTQEVCEIIGGNCNRQHVYWLLRAPNSDFPRPFLFLNGGRLWEKPLIEAWVARKATPAPAVEEPASAGRPKVDKIEPVEMSSDERAAVLNKIFGG